ncbi:MAG: hypothetical protein LIP05_02575, partial [Tannerellaceae bacterium]|nr:hypothetical protein [Tannerellaceae bacterium]
SRDTGYGGVCHLPAGCRKKETELACINYKKPDGDGLFKHLETDAYIREAKDCFEEQAAAYFRRPGLSVKEYTAKLRKEIRIVANILEEGSRLRKEYLDVVELLRKKGIAVPEELPEAVGWLQTVGFREDVVRLKEAEQGVMGYFRQESLWRQVGCILGIRPALESRKSVLALLWRAYPLEVEVLA